MKPFYEVEVRFSKSKPISLRHFIHKVGTIGWAVLVPTALGMAVGVWLDTLWPTQHSWFSILMPVGLVFGCLMAVIWATQE